MANKSYFRRNRVLFIALSVCLAVIGTVIGTAVTSKVTVEDIVVAAINTVTPDDFAVEIGETTFRNFDRKTLDDGTVVRTAKSGPQTMIHRDEKNAAGEVVKSTYEVFRDGKQTRYGEVDATGKEVYRVIYHMNGWRWIVEDDRDPKQSVHENLNPDGSIANRYITKADGTREGTFYDANKLTGRRYKLNGVPTIEHFNANEKLSWRRSFGSEQGFIDTTYDSKGNAGYRQTWDVVEPGYQRQAQLKLIEVLNADGAVVKRILPTAGSKTPQEIHTKQGDNVWRVVFYRANGTAVAAELQNDAGETLKADSLGTETPVQEQLTEEMLKNQDEHNLVGGGVI